MWERINRNLEPIWIMVIKRKKVSRMASKYVVWLWWGWDAETFPKKRMRDNIKGR